MCNRDDGNANVIVILYAVIIILKLIQLGFNKASVINLGFTDARGVGKVLKHMMHPLRVKCLNSVLFLPFKTLFH